MRSRKSDYGRMERQRHDTRGTVDGRNSNRSTSVGGGLLMESPTWPRLRIVLQVVAFMLGTALVMISMFRTMHDHLAR